jgi:site-specific recombinase XerD
MPTLFKRSNGIYYISYTESGIRKQESTGERNKTDALRKLDFFEQPQSAKPTTPSLQNFIKDFLEDAESSFSVGSQTIFKTVFRHFAKFIGSRSLDSIAVKDVDLYRMARAKLVSPVTVNIELRMLRVAFYRAERWKLLNDNPFKRVRLMRIPEQQPTYLTKEDFQKLMTFVSEEWLKDMLVVAVATGMRRGELLNLTWESIDLERRMIHVRNINGFQTKSGKNRSIPMNEMVFGVIWKKVSLPHGKYVFEFRGTRIQESLATHRFKIYVRMAGLDPKIHFHSLRHTFASWLVQDGATLYEVQKLLGHSSLTVTQIYSHLEPEQLQKTVDRIAFI